MVLRVAISQFGLLVKLPTGKGNVVGSSEKIGGRLW